MSDVRYNNISYALHPCNMLGIVHFMYIDEFNLYKKYMT